jgi:large subunit ribosomal protein L18e
MKKTRIKNLERIQLVHFLKKQSRKNKVKIWNDIANYLVKSNRKRIDVNISRLNRYSNTKETIVVPGKILGSGKLDHPITVAAFSYSLKAKDRIGLAKGKSLSIPQLVTKNPKGSNIKIIR